MQNMNRKVYVCYQNPTSFAFYTKYTFLVLWAWAFFNSALMLLGQTLEVYKAYSLGTLPYWVRTEKWNSNKLHLKISIFIKKLYLAPPPPQEQARPPVTPKNCPKICHPGKINPCAFTTCLAPSRCEPNYCNNCATAKCIRELAFLKIIKLKSKEVIQNYSIFQRFWIQYYKKLLR